MQVKYFNLPHRPMETPFEDCNYLYLRSFDSFDNNIKDVIPICNLDKLNIFNYLKCKF